MMEQLETDIKQFKIQKARILAVLLMGKEVTVREIVNYVHKRTGVKIPLNSAGSIILQIYKGPLRKFITKIKHKEHYSYLMTHSFASTQDALAWEKLNGGAFSSKKGNPDEIGKTGPDEIREDPPKVKTPEVRPASNEARSIVIELPQIKITIDFK